MRALQDLSPLVPGGQHPAYRRAYDIFLGLFSILDAPHAKGVQPVLLIEDSRIAGIRGLDHDDPTIENALPVGLVDKIIRQSSQ